MQGWRFPRNAWAWGAMLILPACTQPPGPGWTPSPGPTVATPKARAPADDPGANSAPQRSTACEASRAWAVVGQAVTPERAETARQRAGARIVRVIGYDEIVTKEYNAVRLNLHLDAQGRVARADCG